MDYSGPAAKVVELSPLNVQGNGTYAAFRKSAVGGSNGGGRGSKVGPVSEVGPHRIEVGAQVRQPHVLGCRAVSLSNLKKKKKC